MNTTRTITTVDDELRPGALIIWLKSRCQTPDSAGRPFVHVAVAISPLSFYKDQSPRVHSSRSTFPPGEIVLWAGITVKPSLADSASRRILSDSQVDNIRTGPQLCGTTSGLLKYAPSVVSQVKLTYGRIDFRAINTQKFPARP